MTRATREVVEEVDLSDYSEPEYQKVMLTRGLIGLEGATGILKVRVIQPDGLLCINLEVDLWTSSAPPGGSDANGVATFETPAGDYKIGLNLTDFPLAESRLDRTLRRIVG